MTSDAGWTVIQRRTDGSEDFYRNWEDYKTGFGDPAGEFWLGNELLHQITASKCHRLRIRLEDWEGNVAFAEYDFFAVEGESDGYRLRLGAYSGGTAGDGMRKNADNRFTTKDRDNDVWGHHSANNCANLRDGGWWYVACGSSNLNGVYQQFRDAEPVIIDIRKIAVSIRPRNPI
uniref:Fibrinogen C-terminal domain-containing protein n=1 Tax=Branchiostoma floridae TaxID=7739 RepID=C3Z1K7_BRAFL|eukprot:XP_002597613.1 hypothetical protein BRAFLDRAFT_59120 [Branchiostoma floridae]